MRNIFSKLGVLPALILGMGLFALGLITMNHIVDRWWPFDVARLDLVRATALGVADAGSLMGAANNEAIFAFLAAVMLAVTGICLPIAYFLNKRFGVHSDTAVPEFFIVLRQSMWVGLWATFCVWLQMNRFLGFAIAVLVAVIFILFEFLLQVRTRTATVHQ